MTRVRTGLDLHYLREAGPVLDAARKFADLPCDNPKGRRCGRCECCRLRRAFRELDRASRYLDSRP